MKASATTSVSDRYTWSRKPKRGQRSVTRPMISSYATSDVAIQVIIIIIVPYMFPQSYL